jgi:type I restriction enzyme S subunit
MNAGAPSMQPAPWGEVLASLFDSGQRRMEAHAYLADGYGLRRRIESRTGVSMPVSELTDVWQPPRLKGYVVPDGKGLPFLSAGQTFEAKPRVRKWIAAAMVKDAEGRQVDKRWLLLSCSGEVGRLTAVYDEHLGKIITHDLLRIVPKDPANYGWLYAYFRTPTFYSIARAAQYGHMIKHLEASHVLAMPVVMPEQATRRAIGDKSIEALSLRQRARHLQDQANNAYAALVNPGNVSIVENLWQQVNASDLMLGRRRFEGQFYRSDYRVIERLVRSSATRGVESVGSVSKSVALGNRFKRFFGPDATPYRSAGELFDVNAPITKRIFSGLLDNPLKYILVPGQIVMACSGQTYGLLGRTMILTEQHQGVFGSHDLIRIDPDNEKIRTGYLQTALVHEVYGRPLSIRYASGTSIPHLDPVDIRQVPVPRFAQTEEDTIADLCEEGARLSARADALESEATDEAEAAIADYAGAHAVATANGEDN